MLLSCSYILRIEDAYRSLKYQQKKFRSRVREVKQKYPSLPKEKIYLIANTYTAGIPILAAHTAGAAVDVILLDKNYRQIDLGSSYRELTDGAITNYPDLPTTIKRKRRLLVDIMESEGLMNYPFEYWHFSRGDVGASYLSHAPQAIFGPVNFDPKKQKMAFPDNLDIYSYFKI